MASRTDVLAAIDALGLVARPVSLHSSLRSFGTLDGGADTLIEAFVSKGCTLLVPTFSYHYEQPPPPDRRYPRNGWDYVRHVLPHTSRRFDPGSNDVSREDMGAIPSALLTHAERRRGDHPLSSFAALGPLAGELIDGQSPFDVYTPLERLCELGGALLLAGVDLTSATLLHLAEGNSGRELFRRWALDADGALVECRVGSCSNGFGKLEPALAELRTDARVGASLWRCYDAASALAAATSAIRENPSLTDCGRASCPRCKDAIAGGPVLEDRAIARPRSAG
jgi:aminoglycoside 3-N-acetyltransferase